MSFTEEIHLTKSELKTIWKALDLYRSAFRPEHYSNDVRIAKEIDRLKFICELKSEAAKNKECEMEVNMWQLEPEADKRISAKQVREMLGGISDMSLWRYLNAPDCADMNFPKPVYIKKRRYWSSEELSLWLKQLPRQYVQKASQ
jgi:predicted DNA-binding transcriptional regulator AlpA